MALMWANSLGILHRVCGEFVYIMWLVQGIESKKYVSQNALKSHALIKNTILTKRLKKCENTRISCC